MTFEMPEYSAPDFGSPAFSGLPASLRKITMPQAYTLNTSISTENGCWPKRAEWTVFRYMKTEE